MAYAPYNSVAIGRLLWYDPPQEIYHENFSRTILAESRSEREGRLLAVEGGPSRNRIWSNDLWQSQSFSTSSILGIAQWGNSKGNVRLPFLRQQMVRKSYASILGIGAGQFRRYEFEEAISSWFTTLGSQTDGGKGFRDAVIVFWRENINVSAGKKSPLGSFNSERSNSGDYLESCIVEWIEPECDDRITYNGFWWY
jgi:hypothetical protein